MTLSQKVQIYNVYLASLSKGVKLAALLRSRGDGEEVAEVEKRNQRLAKLAADFRRSLAKEWHGKAKLLLNDIRAENEKLQRRIRKIETSISRAENVVKALGHIDGLVGIGKRILGAG